MATFRSAPALVLLVCALAASQALASSRANPVSDMLASLSVRGDSSQQQDHSQQAGIQDQNSGSIMTDSQSVSSTGRPALYVLEPSQANPKQDVLGSVYIGGEGDSNFQQQLSSQPTSKGSKYSGNKNSKGKDPGGFNGGRQPCTTIPGCQFCPHGKCTVCYYNYGHDRFILKDGECVCPPGFGKLDDNSTSTTKPPAMNTPVWAGTCMACPSGYESQGGPINKARCTRCPGGTTSIPASPQCLVNADCAQGQQPDTISNPPTCAACPLGTFQPNAKSTSPCHLCPDGYTTINRGSTSRADCTVPVCPAGWELQTFDPLNPNYRLQWWCVPCTGVDYSPGGKQEQGVNQPVCKRCHYPEVPDANRTKCYQWICPPPDAFFISCKVNTDLQCTAGTGDPIYLPELCTALPTGAEITWFKGYANDPTTPDTSTPINPPLAWCPTNIGVTDYYYPFITSFEGRQDCLCVKDKTNCYFANGVAVPGRNSPFTEQFPALFVTVSN